MSSLTNAILKGSPTNAKLFSRNPSQRPHYHLLIETERQQFDIAINIASSAHTEDVRVLFAIKQNITPPQVGALLKLPSGMFNLPAQGLHGINYVKDGLVNKDEMHLLPLFDRSAPIEAQGEQKIKQLVSDVIAEPDTVVFAFGHRYDQTSPKNACWGFSPDDGIHNIHMNQGNVPGNHDDENGRGEDGALLLYFPKPNTWVGVYIAFQTQSFDNDEQGYPKGTTQSTTGSSHSQGRHHSSGHHHGQSQPANF